MTLRRFGRGIGLPRFARKRVVGGGGAPAPAQPTLTAPADGRYVHVGQAIAWAATSTDGDLDDVQLVLDPGGSEVVLDTDSSGAYGGTWNVAQAVGEHTLVARARRGGQSTDSAPIDIEIIPHISTMIANDGLTLRMLHIASVATVQLDTGVIQWSDLSGGGHHLLRDETLDNEQPSFDPSDSTLDDQASITGDGGDTLTNVSLDLGTAGSENGLWRVIVMKQNGWTAGRAVVGCAAGTIQMQLTQNTSSPQLRFNNGAGVSLIGQQNSAPLGEWALVEMFANNSADPDTGSFLRIGTDDEVNGVNPGNAEMNVGISVFGRDRASQAECSLAFHMMTSGGRPSATLRNNVRKFVRSLYPTSVRVPTIV